MLPLGAKLQVVERKHTLTFCAPGGCCVLAQDAYGLYPAMRAQGRRHLNKDAAMRYMQSMSYSHHVELTVLDVTVAEGSLACFSHWQAKLRPKWSGAATDSSMGPSLESVEAADAAAAGSSGSSGSSSAAPSSSQQHGAQLQDTSPVVDGMSIDLFNEEMQLKVIWCFRGPVTHAERQLFLQYDRQQAAAEAAQAASEQEAIRAERRAQREQQVRVVSVGKQEADMAPTGRVWAGCRLLCPCSIVSTAHSPAVASLPCCCRMQLSELLAWMNNYQQQWSAYVTHVQKQLARQQRLAKQQLIQQLQDSQDLEGSIEEEELLDIQEHKLGQQLQQQLVQAQQQLQNLQQQAQQQLQNLQQPRDKS
jgi:hypothetical protein